MTEGQLTTLNKLFEETKYEELITQVEADDSLDIQESFKPSLALSYFHTENYKKSTELFSQICEDSKDPLAWFNLCTSAIMNNEERKGLEALNNAIRYNRETETNGKGMPTPFMQLYATKALVDAGKYNLAFNQLNELAEVYGSLSITDSTFLYMRGVPFFEEFTKLSKDILSKQTVTDSKDWIAYVSSRLDDDGKAGLEEIKNNLKA